MGKKTVIYYIERLVNHYKKRRALIFRKSFRTEKWSYLDLYNYAHRVAGFFEEKKLKKGDKAIIYSYNCPEWGAILLACALSWVIAVPLDFNSKKEFVHKITKKIKPKLVFSSIYKSLSLKENEIFIENLFENIEKYTKYKCKANIKEEDILEIVYTSSRKSSTLLEAMKEEKVTSLVGVPIL